MAIRWKPLVLGAAAGTVALLLLVRWIGWDSIVDQRMICCFICTHTYF